jgi:hydrogenase nickel incorporation protein HypA/HybF
MHELSIAHSIVSTAVKAAQDAGVTDVRLVSLQLGELSGVVDEALLFGYEVASVGTILEGTTLEIQRVAARIWCEVCDTERELAAPNRFRCVVCDTPSARLVAGRELQLVGLEYGT